METTKWRSAWPVILGAVAGGYVLWSRSGRRGVFTASPSAIGQTLDIGEDGSRGNIVAVQPHMIGSDYSSAHVFRTKMEGCLAEAATRGWLRPGAVVAFPEHVGTWLVAMGEKRGVYQAATVQQAMLLVLASSLPSLVPALLTGSACGRLTESLFRMKARSMAAAYNGTFGALARKFGVTILAGSIILPGPDVSGGVLRTGGGALQNVCAVYCPDGRADAQLVRKAFPTADEQRFLSAGRVDDLPAFQTPAGRIGVLLCADAWFPQAYAALAQRGVDVVIVPSLIRGADALANPWKGYSGFPSPDDVDVSDMGRISAGEAWDRYALVGRLPLSGARVGIQVCLRGSLWDLGSDGQTVVVQDGSTTRTTPTPDATLVNVWL